MMSMQISKELYPTVISRQLHCIKEQNSQHNIPLIWGFWQKAVKQRNVQDQVNLEFGFSRVGGRTEIHDSKCRDQLATQEGPGTRWDWLEFFDVSQGACVCSPWQRQCWLSLVLDPVPEMTCSHSMLPYYWSQGEWCWQAFPFLSLFFFFPILHIYGAFKYYLFLFTICQILHELIKTCKGLITLSS